MMGGSHAVSGAAAWIAVTSTAPYTLGWYPVSPSGIVIGAIVTAGAALLPDADHHNATIAHSLPSIGPIPSPTALFARWVGAISGGHRHGTHSIVGILAFIVAAYAAALVVVPVDQAWVQTLPDWTQSLVAGTAIGTGEIALGAGLLSFFLIALALKSLKLTSDSSWARSWLLSFLGSAVVTLLAPGEFAWLPVAVCVGVIAHILGDMLTVGGCPILYPYRPGQPKWLKGLVKSRAPELPIAKGPFAIMFYPVALLLWVAKMLPTFLLRKTLGRMWQPNGFFAIPILGLTGSGRELFLASFPLSAYTLWGIAFAVSGAIGLDLGALIA